MWRKNLLIPVSYIAVIHMIIICIKGDSNDPMADVMASIRSGQVKLRKAKVEEKKPLPGKQTKLYCCIICYKSTS